MSRVLYLNCASGISGDMTVGCLLSLGADLEFMRSAVAALRIGPIGLEPADTVKGGVRAVRFVPVIPKGTPRQETMAEVAELLGRPGLAEPVARRSLAVFGSLAEAEAKAHGESPERVHFHELGDPDTIVDIVCAAAGLESLCLDRVFASPVNLGSGTVRMAHGTYPIPAPATAILLSGFEIVSDGETGEKTTPTGAALLAGLARPAREMPALKLERCGYGAGTADFSRSVNVLQGMLGTVSPDAEDFSAVLECNIDDMNPQVYPVLMQRLLESGAQDVFVVPCLMKKGRPGFLVTVVSPTERAETLAGILMAESTTIGLRRWTVERRRADRRIEPMETPWGEVRVKVSRGGAWSRAIPEFEDCRRAAEASGKPLIDIMSLLGKMAMEQFEMKGE